MSDESNTPTSLYRENRKITRFDVFFIIVVTGLWIYYYADIRLKMDEIFFSLFGKNLTGRNPVFQIIVLGSCFLFCQLFPIFLDRLIRRRPKTVVLANTIILVIFAFPVVQLLRICANQILRRDDYWEIADAVTYGFPGSAFYEMERYNGRYTGWGLRSLHALLPHIPYIDIFLFVNLILLTIGTSMLSFCLLKIQKRKCSGMKILAFLTGFGLSIAFILMSSNIWEFWFWGSGTMIYGFGISMCLLSIALILKAADDEHLKIKKMILPAITCFLTCGCSELCTASLAVFLLSALIWKRAVCGKWDKRILFFFAEVCILTAGVFLFSGSLNYAGGYAHLKDGNLVDNVQSLLKRLPVIIGWAVHGLYGYTFIKYKTLLLFLGTALLIGTQLYFDAKSRKTILILVVLLTILAHCVLMINTLLDYMPPRVITVGICWFITAMGLVCLVIGSFLNADGQKSVNSIVLIFCALFLSLGMNRFYQENITELRMIRESWTTRDALLRQRINSSEPVETCSLPCAGCFNEDILQDRDDPYNQGAALYYKLPSIWADLRCPPRGEYFLPSDLYKAGE
ncbi:MAG: hypothetical protein II969_12445 [Anaerolineaceae bacterium]|nr:hypothetical protein [Anaerolineaceae bacterium]